MPKPSNAKRRFPDAASGDPGGFVPAAERGVTLAERAVEEIQALILEERYVPGEHLRVQELAQVLDMSPMPIREALQRLSSLGFVDHIPQRGARVRALSIEDLQDTYSVRLALEELAVRRAAVQFSSDDADQAQYWLKEYAAAGRAGHGAAARRAHREFHFSLYAASGSRWLVDLIRPVFESSERYRITSLPTRGSIEQLYDEHKAILDACVEHDADGAACQMHAHLVRTANILARRLGHDHIIE